MSGTKASINKLISNLKFVKTLREKGVINYLELATVIMERNFREMPEFVDRCLNEFGADKVRLRSYFPFGSMPRHYEWFFDPRNPKHPYYDEYCKVMSNSIFKNEKVLLWSGDELSTQGDLMEANLAKESNYDIIKELVMNSDVGEKLSCYLKSNNVSSVVIYGNGVVGKILINILCSLDVTIEAIFDKYSCEKNYKGISVVVPGGNVRCEMIIVTTPYDFDNIQKDLKSKGYNSDITHINTILFEC